MLSYVKHERSFITTRPDMGLHCLDFCLETSVQNIYHNIHVQILLQNVVTVILLLGKGY